MPALNMSDLQLFVFFIIDGSIGSKVSCALNLKSEERGWICCTSNSRTSLPVKDKL